MELILYHPVVASRSCDDCQRWLYDDTPQGMGEIKLDWKDNFLPMVRPKGVPTPCSRCPKIPGDVPIHQRKRDRAVEMTDKSWRCYKHYLDCRAVGKFPDDPIVRRCAAVIRNVEDRYRQGRVTRKLDEIIVQF